MIYPLLKRQGFSIKAGKIFAAMARWAADLKKSVIAFFTAFREKGSSQKIPDREKLRRIASELLSGNIRRKDLKQSVNLFARLILWGIETLKVPWKPSLAPGEYCGLMAAAFSVHDLAEDPGGKDTAKGIIRSAELFEKALYSPRRLSGAEEKEYRSLIKRITGGN